MSTKATIEKWYKAIGFSSSYDEEFYDALNKIEIKPFKISEFDINSDDGVKNFLSHLYMCEELYENYKEKGIPEEVFYNTISDLIIWLDIWSDLKGKMYLGQLDWLSYHFNMKIFRLGRLQFAMSKSKYDADEKGLRKGDDVLDVHIPAIGPLKKEECAKSFEDAKIFFAKYFPDYTYEFFTCHSWLMDETLKEFLPPKSNILEFQNIFEIFQPTESYAILGYVFRWMIKKEELASITPTSSFAERVQKWVLDGNKLYSALGIIENN